MLCEEKKAFKSEAAAKSWSRNVTGRVKHVLNQYAYVCRSCHYYHLTTELESGGVFPTFSRISKHNDKNDDE